KKSRGRLAPLFSQLMEIGKRDKGRCIQFNTSPTITANDSRDMAEGGREGEERDDSLLVEDPPHDG
ncbi:unnamed protein product, partial [Dovyalis caffra]